MIFTVNAGSSSLKFAFYNETEDEPLAHGMIERIGQNPCLHLSITGKDKIVQDIEPNLAHDNPSTLSSVFKTFRENIPNAKITAIGHRIVHGGMGRDRPTIINDELLTELQQLSPFAPLHQPYNIAGVKTAMEHYPEALQVACFDTAFHRHHPFVNDAFALPRTYYDKGIRRYGFHGLSYEYIASELKRSHPHLYNGRVVVAHLGSGASMCAIKAGHSMSSTMGFSALDGLPMATRCGQIDPEVILYLIEHENMTPAEVTNMLYKESGMLGLSGVSNDMRDLAKSDNPHAREARDYFVFRIRRELAAMAAAMDGLDAVVFCGGIGENDIATRAEVCQGMEWIGITLDDKANNANAQKISADGPISVMVIPTNEELIIARATRELLPKG